MFGVRWRIIKGQRRKQGVRLGDCGTERVVSWAYLEVLRMETFREKECILPVSSKCFRNTFSQLLVYFKRDSAASYKTHI